MVETHGTDPGMLISDILDATTSRWPDRTALVWDSGQWTFATLQARALAFAARLGALGVAEGDRVGVCLSNRCEYPVAYFGIAYAGAVSVHLPVRFARAEIEYVLDRIPLAALLTERALGTVATAAAARLPPDRLMVLGTDDESIMCCEAPPPGAERGQRATDESASAILFTSGTTGLPKGVVQPHHGRALSARVAIADFGLTEHDVLAIASPLYHAAGLYTWYQAGVMAGASAVLTGAWDAAAFVDAVERHRITGAFAVPTQLAMLLEHPRFDPERLKSLRIIVYGGAPSDPTLIEALEARLPWVAFIQNYGQTETGPLFSLQPGDRHADPGALGRPNDLIDLALFAAPGRRSVAGEVGEIATRGAHVALGYFGDPVATRGLFKTDDEWAWTGDLATMSPAGLLRLVGRTKDTIIAGGVNIYPAEIERALGDHPAVADCAAFGLPDVTWGELPAVAVVLVPGATLTLDEAERFLDPYLARFKRPRSLHIVDTLPYTPVGKLVRSALRERFGTRS
jgi:acyl-CoA synthetase (AMP-forming)/AMP-acid ligase II